jgi:hypothetical protein
LVVPFIYAIGIRVNRLVGRQPQQEIRGRRRDLAKDCEVRERQERKETNLWKSQTARYFISVHISFYWVGVSPPIIRAEDEPS